MGLKPELSIHDAPYTYKGIPCYIVNVSDKMDLCFTKKDQILMWVEDYHLGEVARYHTQEDLEWFKKNRANFYKLALGAVRSYVRNPQRFLAYQESVRESNKELIRKDRIQRKRKATIEQKKREASRSELLQPHLKFPIVIEILSDGKFRGFDHAQTIKEARLKAYKDVKEGGWWKITDKIYKTTSKGLVLLATVKNGDIGKYYNVIYLTSSDGYFFITEGGMLKKIEVTDHDRPKGPSAGKYEVNAYVPDKGHFYYYANTIIDARALSIKLIKAGKARFTTVSENKVHKVHLFSIVTKFGPRPERKPLLDKFFMDYNKDGKVYSQLIDESGKVISKPMTEKR